MQKLMMHVLVGIWLAHFGFPAAPVITAHASLTLARIEIKGTTRLSSDDVAAGLNLKIGKEITRDELKRACARFDKLKLFDSARCEYHIEETNAALSVMVKDPSTGLSVVFDNFVWLTRGELLARLKREIPLFMSELPEQNGLIGDIIRVLEKVAKEHGIEAKIAYDDRFWVIRGMAVFYITDFSAPVSSFQIEGENSPSPEEFQNWSKSRNDENYSAARLTRTIDLLIRDFYSTRGFIHPVVGMPRVECLTQKDSAYPVQVIIPISSGELYKFGSVEFEGLTKPHVSFLLAKWKLDPGAPYDDSYVKHFVFEEILNQSWGMQSKNESRDVSVCSQPDETNKKVDVTIKVESRKRVYHVVPGVKSCTHLGTINFPSVP
jgi:outer membrane protein assembly factor BamA